MTGSPPQSPSKQNILFSLLYPLNANREELTASSAAWRAAADRPKLVEHIFPREYEAEASEDPHEKHHTASHKGSQLPTVIWNRAARSSNGEILIQLTTITEPIKQWDSKIARRFRDLSKPGVLRVSDMLRVDDLLPIAIFTRSYLDAIGGLFLCEEYTGAFSQDEFSFRAYQHGVVIDARDIVMEKRPDLSETPGADTARDDKSIDYDRDRRIFLRRNPSARGHWFHEGTEQRYYLPPGHFYAQNILGCSVNAPSPLGRPLPEPEQMPEHFNLQVGYHAASPKLNHRVAQSLKTRVVRAIQAAKSAWRTPRPYRSTLWPSGRNETAEAGPPCRAPCKIPVFIIHYDQPYYLRNMVRQLRALDVAPEEIVILDNSSRGEASVRLLNDLEKESLHVVRLERNFGPHGIFSPESGIEWPEVFALTDPDLEFDPAIPSSFRQDLFDIASACGVWKCGCAISLADTHLFSPSLRIHGQAIAEWEKQFWRDERRDLPEQLAARLSGFGAKIYRAPVDTTFAVYRRDAWRAYFVEGVRVSGAFECKHLPWYDSCPHGEATNLRGSRSSKGYFSTIANISGN